MDIPRQGGVRNGYFCHSGASGAHGDLRRLSTHLCESVHLVQVWLPKRGSQAVGCFMVTLRANFNALRFNPTAKDNFSMSFTILRFMAEGGRSTREQRSNPKFLQIVLQKSPTYSISQYFLTLGVSKSKRFQQKRG